jgi:hypothetical protein
MDNDGLEKLLKPATDAFGAELSENIPPPLYNFVRRYTPMLCTDAVVLPEGPQPSVLLLKRGVNAVAPGQYYILGGRVSKNSDVLGTIQDKVRKESGLALNFTWDDLIGSGFPRFPPDANEASPRDYTVVTPTFCFTKQIPLDKSKINPADGHSGWRVFTSIDLDHMKDPYVFHAVARAWDRFYGTSWRAGMTEDVSKRLNETKNFFIPTKYEG